MFVHKPGQKAGKETGRGTGRKQYEATVIAYTTGPGEWAEHAAPDAPWKPQGTQAREDILTPRIETLEK